MKPLILTPIHGEECYKLAVERFCALYRSITQKTATVAEEDDGCSDLFFIGNDTVNDHLAAELFADRTKPLGIRYGTDDYLIRIEKRGKRHLVILAGGRARSTLYAIYDFFERFAGCHYFWDGDVIPQCDDIPLAETELVCRPRFEYRGLRYFAHRGLHRFQAEHWSFEEWERELDFLIKRRLNFFMLRIGMDDLWQHAFPDAVPYPDKWTDHEPFESTGYNDRNLFWSLEYRGELRRRVLALARRLDLLYPEDCGTVSHWYSPAPLSFLAAHKPDFLQQFGIDRNLKKTLVWDIRLQRNMDLYMKLTETAVNTWSPGQQLFHTIGLAERCLFEKHEDNIKLKCYAIHKIAQNLRERYPSSTLMLASWDFLDLWRGEDVRQLLSELDPTRTVILDYAGEMDDEREGFLHWGLVGKFPWIFGLFHAWEPESTLRGPYDRTDARLRVAADDPMCRGMVFWPELSHSDPLVLEYLAENAWSPLSMTAEELAARFCERRYGALAEQMNAVWQTALPLIKLDDWGGNTRRTPEDPEYEKYIKSHAVHKDLWFSVDREFRKALGATHEHAHYAYKLKEVAPLLPRAAKVLRLLAGIGEQDSPFFLRDRLDLARTMVGRTMSRILLALILKKDEPSPARDDLLDRFFALLDILGDLLSLHEDYSLYATLKHLEKTEPVPPQFEETLINNTLNPYCRSQIFEFVKYLYPKECHTVLGPFYKDEKKRQDFHSIEEIEEQFRSKSLREMQYRAAESFATLAERAAAIIDALTLVDKT